MSLQYNFPTGQVFQQFSPVTYAGLLIANTAQSLTVPGSQPMGISSAIGSGDLVCIITVSPNSTVWVANNTTAIIPVTTIGAISQEMVPPDGEMIKIVKAGDVLSFITSGSNIQYGVAFYQSL